MQRLQVALREFDRPKFDSELRNLKALAPENIETKKWSDNQILVHKYLNFGLIAKRAGLENNLNAELEASKEMVQLGFGNAQLNKRIKILEIKFSEKRFHKYMSSAKSLIELGKLSEAETQILKAQNLFGAHPDLKELKKLLQKITKSKQVLALLRQADQNAALDHWETAQDYYAQAMIIIPTSKRADTGQRLSMKIVGMQRQLLEIDRQPMRLKSSEVTDYVKKLLTECESFLSKSGMLKNLHSRVSNIVEKKMVPRDIWIDSDGLAKIKIQGVGYIEPTEGKSVKLMPGEYLFFAECNRRKTKIYEVIVPYDIEISTIRIICGDEI